MDLTFPEELLLLALHDTDGTILPGTAVQQGLAAGVLAELLLGGRLRLESSKQLVSMQDPTPTGNAVIDECLLRIRESRRRRRLQTWVQSLVNRGDLRHAVARGLARQGILRIEEDKVLLIFTRKIYPEVDHLPERALIERLRQVIFHDGEVDPRSAIILSLADATGILPHIFDKKLLENRKKRIKEITSGNFAGAAAEEAIAAMHAAVFATTIVPVIIITAT